MKTKSALFASAFLALAACGNDPAPVAPPPTVNPPPPTAPVNVEECVSGQNATQADFIESCVMPQYQKYFGSIILESDVVLSHLEPKFEIKAGEYTWPAMYVQIRALAERCGCLNSELPQMQNQVSAYARIDYRQFFVFVAGEQGERINSWNHIRIRTQSGITPFDVNNRKAVFNFYDLYNMMVSMSYLFYSQIYFVNYSSYYVWPTWNYWPLIYAGASAQSYFNHSTSVGLSLNFGTFSSSYSE